MEQGKTENETCENKNKTFNPSKAVSETIFYESILM